MSRWVRWLGLAIGIGLFLWILFASDLAGVWLQVRNIRWQFLLIFLFYSVIFGLDTLGWKFALRPKGVDRLVRWDHLFRARLAGEAVNYLTPTVGIGGEPIKALLLSRRYGVPLTDGMASVVIAKTTFALSMLLFIVTGLIVALLTQPISSSLFVWIGIVLPVLGILLALFLLVQFLQPFRMASGLIRQFVPKAFLTIGSRLHEWDQAITSFYRHSPRELLLSLSFHFLGWAAGAIEVFLILRFLHIPVSLSTAWSLEALWVLLRSGAFLIPASLGASEGLALLVCVGLGFSAVSGLSLALIRRARELLWMGLGLLEFSRG